MRVRATEHAIIRFRERVRPTLGFNECREELERLLQAAELVTEGPDWAVSESDADTDHWVYLTEDIVCPIFGDGSVPTVLVRGMVPETHRANLNRRKAQKRHAKHYRNQNYIKKRRPKSRIEDEAWPV